MFYTSLKGGYIMSPRGVYSSLQRGILEVPKGYFRVPRSVYFCFRRVRLGNTSIHVVYNILFVDRKLYKLYQMGLRDCLFFCQNGNLSMWCLVQRPSKVWQCQKHVRCLLPLENGVFCWHLKGIEGNITPPMRGVYYTFWKGYITTLRRVYYR